MAANANLHKAKDAKNDEFYTQLTDVSKELMHYKQHFKDKIVLCNCDDPTWSAFWKYFHLNFSELRECFLQLDSRSEQCFHFLFERIMSLHKIEKLGIGI